MANHFTLSDATYQRPKALCPWKDVGDEDYFADVDGTKKAFDEYAEHAHRQVHFVGGSFHLAFGPEGCGKTSLINRCVSYFQNTNDSKLGEEKSTVIVDVSSDIGAAVAAAHKGEEAWQIVSDELPLHIPTLTEDQIKKINDESKSMMSRIRLLSRCLAENGCSLAVILPDIELEKEFESYFALMRDNVALFAETTRDEIEQYCRRVFGPQSGTPVQIMRLNPLGLDDGKTFVDNRLARRTETCPEIEANIIDQVMQKRIEGGAGASIRELHMVCEAVYEAALTQGKVHVQYEDFTEHYMKFGVVP